MPQNETQVDDMDEIVYTSTLEDLEARLFDLEQKTRHLSNPCDAAAARVAREEGRRKMQERNRQIAGVIARVVDDNKGAKPSFVMGTVLDALDAEFPRKGNKRWSSAMAREYARAHGIRLPAPSARF